MILTAALLANAATLAAQGAAPARPQSPDQEAPKPFRVSVDVVAVDVQAIDREGKPVPDLGPEKFTVTINGRRRRVVSAERIGIDDARGAGDRADGARASAYLGGRVIMLAVDCVSFDATASRGVIQAVAPVRRATVAGRLRRPLGVSERPEGRSDDGSCRRPRARSTAVVGQRDLAEMTQFHVRPSEIVDVTREI